MWQFPVRVFVVAGLSWLFVGCGSISHQSTNSTPPPADNQPQGKVFVAASFPAPNCGAKILAADKAADQNGIIEVTPACGTTWTTQVVVGPTHTLSVENGTYQIAHTVLLHDNACVTGQSAVLTMARPLDFIRNADAV